MLYAKYYFLAGRYRDLWAAHAAHVHGVLFVVDVTDRARIAVAREELHAILASRGDNHDGTDLQTLLSSMLGQSIRRNTQASEHKQTRTCACCLHTAWILEKEEGLNPECTNRVTIQVASSPVDPSTAENPGYVASWVVRLTVMDLQQ